jgi:chorismate synthase
MNTIGTKVRLTLFGSSHGAGIGCVLDGIPAGTAVDEARIREEMRLRRPSEGIGTPRREDDEVELLSGVREGRATGAPITMLVRNQDKDSSKYERFRTVPRPGHADLTALTKYGESHDLRGGGQFSGRMTAPIVAAGSIARCLLEEHGMTVVAYTRSIGGVVDGANREAVEMTAFARANPLRAATQEMADMMRAEIEAAARDGDSVGGTVRCMVFGPPMGMGEPFFDTVEGELAKFIFAIPGVKGIEFGAGFRAAGMRGSEHNDPIVVEDGRLRTAKNDAGGVLGGISNGMPIDMLVAFKPTASIAKEQMSVDLSKMRESRLRIEGRHDPCIVPRAVAAVEAATALTVADLCLRGGLFD